MTTLLALDLGAESGRAIVGRFDGERATLEEIHRFANGPLSLPDGLHWDEPALLREIERALAIAAERGIALDAMAVDTWGVDYGLLDGSGELLGLPFHYRDGRTAAMVARAHALVPPAELYAATGCQTIPLNTLFQLLADQDAGRLVHAETMLLMPDLIAWRLTGGIAAERTIASTTQLYDPVRRDWASVPIARLGLPARIFPPLQSPGSRRGTLRDEIEARTGTLPGLPVIAVGSHDTASAFAAVASGPDSLVISSGTWSLIGIETDAPILTAEARDANFTNEAGVADTNRFLRNHAGMWVIQECRRVWAAAGRAYGYDELHQLAAAAPRLTTILDPNDPVFVPPGGMPDRIAAYCARTNQPAPDGPGAFVRAVLESLALVYRAMVEQTARISGRAIERLHIIGGGSRSALHCQLAADATGLPVLAGPVEATALGNAMTQALALGAVSSLDEARDVIRRSVTPAVYEPRGDRPRWDDAFARFKEMTAGW